MGKGARGWPFSLVSGFSTTWTTGRTGWGRPGEEWWTRSRPVVPRLCTEVIHRLWILCTAARPCGRWRERRQTRRADRGKPGCSGDPPVDAASGQPAARGEKMCAEFSHSLWMTASKPCPPPALRPQNEFVPCWTSPTAGRARPQGVLPSTWRTHAVDSVPAPDAGRPPRHARRGRASSHFTGLVSAP